MGLVASFCRRRESDVPLTKTVVLPPTVESDDPVTFSPDVLSHRPHHRFTGSGSQKCHAILKLHPAKEKYQQKKKNTELDSSGNELNRTHTKRASFRSFVNYAICRLFKSETQTALHCRFIINSCVSS